MATNTYKKIPNLASASDVTTSLALKADKAGDTFTGNVDIDNQKALRLFEADANGSNKVTIQAPASLAADYTFTLPVDDGTSNQVLTTDGSGVLSWTAPTWSTFTPTVTLVGGAGNIVPVYSTNIGRYSQQGKIVNVQIYLTGDGGAEGAGTGQITIALPVAAGANNANGPFSLGTGRDGVFPGSANFHALGVIAPAAVTIPISIFSGATTTVALTGADQASVNRTIRLQFFYEID